MKGFTKIDNKVLFSKDLHPFSKLVFTSLTYYTRNGEGSCFARKTTLSRMIGISLYHLRKSLKELEEKQLIKIIRKGQGNPDTIYLNDFQSTYENPTNLLTIIEEEKKIEEEESIPNINNITPKDDNPPADGHQVGTPDGISTPNTDNIKKDAPQSHQAIRNTQKQRCFDCCDDLKTKPDPLYQRATETIRNEIQPQIGIKSYQHFFSNISVVAETEDTVSLTTPHGKTIAQYINEQYSAKLENITNKRVEVSG